MQRNFKFPPIASQEHAPNDYAARDLVNLMYNFLCGKSAQNDLITKSRRTWTKIDEK